MILIHECTQFVSVLLSARLDDAVRHEPIMLKLVSTKSVQLEDDHTIAESLQAS